MFDIARAGYKVAVEIVGNISYAIDRGIEFVPGLEEKYFFVKAVLFEHFDGLGGGNLPPGYRQVFIDDFLDPFPELNHHAQAELPLDADQFAIGSQGQGVLHFQRAFRPKVASGFEHDENHRTHVHRVPHRVVDVDEFHGLGLEQFKGKLPEGVVDPGCQDIVFKLDVLVFGYFGQGDSDGVFLADSRVLADDFYLRHDTFNLCFLADFPALGF